MSRDYRTYHLSVVLVAPCDLDYTQEIIYEAMRTLIDADVKRVRLDYDEHDRPTTVFVKPWTG